MIWMFGTCGKYRTSKDNINDSLHQISKRKELATETRKAQQIPNPSDELIFNGGSNGLFTCRHDIKQRSYKSYRHPALSKFYDMQYVCFDSLCLEVP